LHPSFNKEKNPLSVLHYYAYGNVLKLKIDADLDKNELFVKWVCEDQQAVCKELEIYVDGKITNTIPFEKGKQELEIYYKNQLIGKLQQNKSSEKQAHSYYINLIKKGGEILLTGEISGPSEAMLNTSINVNDFVLSNH
jgi:hypothetical protein